jgi:hypothetical protein
MYRCIFFYFLNISFVTFNAASMPLFYLLSVCATPAQIPSNVIKASRILSEAISEQDVEMSDDTFIEKDMYYQTDVTIQTLQFIYEFYSDMPEEKLSENSVVQYIGGRAFTPVEISIASKITETQLNEGISLCTRLELEHAAIFFVLLLGIYKEMCSIMTQTSAPAPAPEVSSTISYQNTQKKQKLSVDDDAE